MAADLVIFNPNTIQDMATFTSPKVVSKGITHVIVNGEVVIKSRMITRNRPGIFLHREKHHIKG